MTTKNEKLLVNLILVITSFFFSFIFFNDQVAVRGGLVISGEISFEDNISPLKYYFLNSWTLLTQLSAFFLQLGITVKLVSLILVFCLNLILFYSCYAVLKKFTNDIKLSILCTTFLIFFQKNLGDTDYPSLIFSIHTFGAYAQAISGLIIVSVILKNFKISLFLSLLLLAIHPIVGLWFLLLFILLIFFRKKEIKPKDFKLTFLLGVSIVFFSFLTFIYFSIESFSYDQNLFNTYLEKWDGHRSRTKEIHFEYIIKSLIIIIFLNCLFYQKEKFKTGLIFLNLIFISSFFIYFLFRITNLNNFNILSMVIPGRFMIVYTFILWPITLAFLYKRFEKVKFIKSFFYALIILYSIMHYKNFFLAKDKLVELSIVSRFNVEDKVFEKLSQIENTGNVIATEATAFKTLYFSKKPVLLMKSFDFLPLHKYLTNSVSKILTEVYGYDFNNPPIKNVPHLKDKFIRETFENRSVDDWRKIKINFKSNYIIVPNNWTLSIEKVFSDSYYSLYKI